MTYAMFTSSDSSTKEVILRRDGRNKIIVTTVNELSDDQMRDLYWTVLAMERTGKTLKELMNPVEK